MPVITLTDYLTLLDRSVTLESNSVNNSFLGHFTPPDDFVQGTDRARPVLYFRFRALDDVIVDIERPSGV